MVPLIHLWIQCTIVMLHITGFPHSDTRGSRLICSSPRLFAACRVLLRRPMPRHSPCALLSLNFMSFANLFTFEVIASDFRHCLSLCVCSIVTQFLKNLVRILDLLSLHLCFIQFSRYKVGSSGLEPPTSRLSGARSSLLSYEPVSGRSCSPVGFAFQPSVRPSRFS